MSAKITLSEAEWRERLSPEQFRILREAGTERAFTGKYDKNKAAGEYRCAGCGQPLFESEAKFESHSGWPSFTRPANGGAIEEHRDAEVVCAKCHGHLGHVFADGPRDRGGLRYCINSAALEFKPEDN